MINVLVMILAVAAAQAPTGNAVNGKAVFTRAGCYVCLGNKLPEG